MDKTIEQIAKELSSQYRQDNKFVERGLLACERAEVDPNYFIQRYLMGDRSVALDKKVDAVYRDLFLHPAYMVDDFSIPE